MNYRIYACTSQDEGGDDPDTLEEDDTVLGEEGGGLVLLVKVKLGVGARRVVRAQGAADLWKNRI